MKENEPRWTDPIHLLIAILSLLFFIGIWYALAWWDHRSPAAVVLVYPDEVLRAIIDSFFNPDWRGYLMHEDIVASLNRLLWGFLLSMAIALPIGILAGYSAYAMAASKPIIEIIRPIPPLAWLPVVLILFGKELGPIMIVFVGIFFPVLLAVIFGVRSVPSELVDAARTLGANSLGIFKKVIIPFMVPYMMNGIYIGLGVGWMCIVAAEILPVGGGVGRRLWSAYEIGRYEFMFASIVILGLLGLITTEFARGLSRKVREWMGMAEE